MAELFPIDFNLHLQNVIQEYQNNNSVYGFPARFFYQPPEALDTSVNLFGKRAATPLGPAAGPHTQLAQNIVLSWLYGSRFIELKTVQVLESLEIPRPCIDMRNIGYNVEWSQELSLDQSFREYAHAWALIHLLPRLGIFQAAPGDPFYDTIFDMSLGYDLEGIASPKVSRWLNQMQNAGFYIEQLMQNLPPALQYLKDTPIPERISDSVTLSTFHGCPPQEIEQIVEHLIANQHLNVIIKLNPTLAGFEVVDHLLHRELGYEHIQLVPDAFEEDLQFPDAVAMIRRLQKFARKHKQNIGVKLTNTLVVANNEQVFTEKQRYLSGPPLFVIAMHLVSRLRDEFADQLSISFSGGIDRDNFPEAVSCGLTPVTTCSDLLKSTGYRKLQNYMSNLEKSMRLQEAGTIREFIYHSAPKTNAGPAVANSHFLAKSARQDARYKFSANNRLPKKGDTKLSLFDCITCKLCLPVCPNAANFTYRLPDKQIDTHTWNIENGEITLLAVKPISFEKDTQIGNLNDFCNACGNCDTFCPELGGPFLMKARFYLLKENFDQSKHEPAFHFSGPNALHLRLEQKSGYLKMDTSNGSALWQQDGVEFYFDSAGELVKSSAAGLVKFDDRLYQIGRIIYEGIHSQPEQYPHYLLLNMRPGGA